jgi:hypothetical protein
VSYLPSLYNPVDHSLNYLKINDTDLFGFYAEINSNFNITNGIVIWMSIQLERTTSKYDSAESLYWRDAGALLYCIQLVWEYLNLKSCPKGALAANTFSTLFHTDKLFSGGAF